MKGYSLLLAGIICLCYSTYAQQKSFNVDKLAVTWEVVENNHAEKMQFLSALTITNKNKSALPDKGWSLYFNFVRNIHPQSVTSDVMIEHVNGDLFRVLPTQEFSGLASGKSLRVEFIADAWVVNFTDAPMGLYWVWDNENQNGIPVENYIVKPSTQPKQYLRFAGDKVGLVTPQMTYEQNSAIKDITIRRLTKVFPTPREYKETGGEFLLDNTVEIVADKIFQAEATYLQNELAVIMSTPPKVLPATPAGAQKRIFLKQSSMPDEAYTLQVRENRIDIAASTPVGVFYGIQSLKTLIPPDAWKNKSKSSLIIPTVDVQDEPRFAHRALMLDVARNFQGKDQILKVLDVMSLYKLNVLHFHFSDDEGWRIEIAGLPELTAVGARRGHTTDGKDRLLPSYGSGPDVSNRQGSGYYSKSDFIEILKYASARHIRVIPEIETPGHARAAIKAMDARYGRLVSEGKKEDAEQFLLRDPRDESSYRSVQLWNDNVINVAMPSVYRFLEKVVDELLVMYKEAGAPISTIHFGGDEVPAGVWEKSPVCQALIEKEPSLNSVDDLWYYYFGKINELLKSKGLFLYGWEEIAMRKTKLDGANHMIPNPDFCDDGFQVDVWNNVLGWGAEDLAYRLANAGYKVVLSCVSNLYFDMAYQKDFMEPGYYWGAFVDVDKPFDFIPYDYFKNVKEDRLGNPLDKTAFVGKERLTDYGKKNIVGIQGLLWSETINSKERMEYMLLSKLLGLAERAWAKDPDWAAEKDPEKASKQYAEAWTTFTITLGKRELPRLDFYAGGFNYRIPTAGAVQQDGQVFINSQFPGLTIRYTTDGSEPTVKSEVYKAPIRETGEIKIRIFSSNGRGGRTVSIHNR